MSVDDIRPVPESEFPARVSGVAEPDAPLVASPYELESTRRLAGGVSEYVAGRRQSMSEAPVGCARVTGNVAGEGSRPGEPIEAHDSRKEASVTARVGQKAPDFTAPAYHRGGFTSVQLSSFAGKWVLLCFYPGDFTFV